MTLAGVEEREPSFPDGVRIREVWIGNLASSVTKGKLYKHFFVYGEIEDIDMFMFKNFAFVKFREVAAACRAHEQARGLRVDGRPIKISFSDHTRRKEAIGDTPGYSLNELNAKAVLLRYKNVSRAPDEELLRSILSRYGSVNVIHVLEIPQDPTFRPHVYVEYFTHVLLML